MSKTNRAIIVCAIFTFAGIINTIARPAAGQGAAKTPSGAANLIPNASFEDMDGNRPAGWRPVNFGARGTFAVDEAVAHSGKRSARISSETGADAGYQIVLPVRPYSKYRLSGFIRVENVVPGTSKGALFNVHGMDIMTPAVSGTRDWACVQTEFDLDAVDSIAINCLFGGFGRATGAAWFDDLELTLLSSRPMKPQAAIDAATTLAPISKYIYGQFIEHLGRCIYQGIWAEMLEDRKFYYGVGAKESPWKAVGNARNVRMNPILPYVGVQAPEIRLTGKGEPGGIVQEGLAVLAGKKYVGRIVIAGDPGALPVRVSLIWGEAPEARATVAINELGGDYRTVPLAFTAGAASDAAKLEIASSGSEAFRVGTVSLMPADNVEGFRPDVLELLRRLDSPVYRWPGGNFVSGYDWHDGLGDPDRRPPRKNPAWQGVEHNDVGIHEFMRLCELIKTEPFIAVNSGQGSETLAADEVEYTNGGPETPMGKMRAKNGHPAPWGVKWWSIGNEMYGNWQLGSMPLEDYWKRHNRFAAAMRAKDPAIKLIAVGEVGPWSEGMLANSAEFMDLHERAFLRPDPARHAQPRQPRPAPGEADRRRSP